MHVPAGAFKGVRLVAGVLELRLGFSLAVFELRALLVQLRLSLCKLLLRCGKLAFALLQLLFAAGKLRPALGDGLLACAHLACLGIKLLLCGGKLLCPCVQFAQSLRALRFDGGKLRCCLFFGKRACCKSGLHLRGGIVAAGIRLSAALVKLLLSGGNAAVALVDLGLRAFKLLLLLTKLLF